MVRCDERKRLTPPIAPSWAWLPALTLAVGSTAPAEVGLEAVRAAIAREGKTSVIAELALPRGREPSMADVEAARVELAQELAKAGVPEVRGMGSLPYVAFEVDARQLEAALASGRVRSVAPNRAATAD